MIMLNIWLKYTLNENFKAVKSESVWNIYIKAKLFF